MALYRTERRLNWNHALRIGHWHAPWSAQQADTGGDYFSRTLRWLRNQYPKAEITTVSHALPLPEQNWPQERFGLDESNAQAGDLLLIEWPQPTAVDHPSDTTEGAASFPPDVAERANNPQPDISLPPQWANGLERALRRTWKDNPEAEIVLIGGPHGICTAGSGLAMHYGITVVDPAARLAPASPALPDYRKALIDENEAGTPASLTPQGHEIWAGMLIALLREQLRYGPTPEPGSLPDGLWQRKE